MKARMCALVMAALMLTGSPAAAQISISDIVAVIQLVRDWVEGQQPAQPEVQGPAAGVYIYYKWVGSYDYLESGGKQLSGCGIYIGPDRKDNFLLFVLLAHNRTDTPIYLQPDGFRLDAYQNNRNVGIGVPDSNRGLVCLRPPWSAQNRPANPRMLTDKQVGEIPIFQQNRFPGGVIAPGQKIAGQLFIRMEERFLRNYPLRFHYTDGRQIYDYGDYLAGSRIPVFYENIPG